MNRAKLTTRSVASAIYSGKGRRPHLLADSDLRGLFLRIQPSGVKSYIIRYRTKAGRQGWHTLGRADVLTPSQARTEAKRLLAAVVDGEDPAEQRRQARRAGTFSDLVERYLEERAPQKRSRRDDVQRARDHLLPALGSRPIAAVSRADVAAIHRRIGTSRPILANRILALVSSIYSWGERTGVLSEGWPNPARGVPHFKETSRERWLTQEEVKRLVRALQVEPSVHIRGFFWLLLLLGVRKSELLTARWSDVDLVEGVLRIDRTKAGRVHIVPVSGPALAVLKDLPREQGNPFIFPSTVRPGAHLINVEKPWRRVCRRAGVSDARVHDVRRTVGSWLTQSGASLALVGAVLDHTNVSTTKVYAKLADSDRREALEQHAQAVLAAAEGRVRMLEAGQ